MDLYFKNNEKPDICLVFCGWGTDERLYLPVLKDMDYLLCFNYDENLIFNHNIDFDKYENKYLLTYSAGGFIPTVINNLLPDFTMKVSVNSSTQLFNRYGLSQELIKEVNNLNTENFLIFRRQYMVDSDWEFEMFNKNQPRRTFESCHNELKSLEILSKKFKNNLYKFDKVFSAENDKVLPYKFQKELYGDDIIKIEGGHFPFYRYNSLKEFFAL